MNAKQNKHKEIHAKGTPQLKTFKTKAKEKSWEQLEEDNMLPRWNANANGFPIWSHRNQREAAQSFPSAKRKEPSSTNSISHIFYPLGMKKKIFSEEEELKECVTSRHSFLKFSLTQYIRNGISTCNKYKNITKK